MSLPVRIVAHRGLWNVEGSAQNSLTSLRLAFEELRYAGAETDVYQTLDGQLVLSHDPEIDGHYINATIFDIIRSCRLKNGEPVPTLQEALDLLAQYPGNILMLDIKDIEIDVLVEALKDYKYMNRLIFKSFSVRVCRELVANSLSPVYLLTRDINDYELDLYTREKFAGVSAYCQPVFAGKGWIDRFHKRNLKFIAWGIDTPDELSRIMKIDADFVVTDLVPAHFK